MSNTKKEEFTPGPWRWMGDSSTKDIYLATTYGGRYYVMGFERWGMHGAQPTFQPAHKGIVNSSKLLKYEVGDPKVTGEEEAKTKGNVYRKDIKYIDAPDAHLIAAAPCLYEAVKLAQSRMQPGSELHDRMSDVLSKARGEMPA